MHISQSQDTPQKPLRSVSLSHTHSLSCSPHTIYALSLACFLFPTVSHTNVYRAPLLQFYFVVAVLFLFQLPCARAPFSCTVYLPPSTHTSLSHHSRSFALLLSCCFASVYYLALIVFVVVVIVVRRSQGFDLYLYFVGPLCYPLTSSPLSFFSCSVVTIAVWYVPEARVHNVHNNKATSIVHF